MVTLTAKKAIVEEVSSVASKAISAVVAEYRGLTVNQMNELRLKARPNVFIKVVRNTLTQRAFQNTTFECLSDSLKGPVFIALSMDSPSDAARLLKEYSKTFDKLTIKALSIGGKVYEADQLDAIASLPTKDEAIAKLMAVMKAPVEKLARTLAEPHAKLVRLMAAVRDVKQA